MMESSGILAELLKQTALGVYLIRSKKPPFGYCDIHLNVRLNQASGEWYKEACKKWLTAIIFFY